MVGLKEIPFSKEYPCATNFITIHMCQQTQAASKRKETDQICQVRTMTKHDKTK